MSSKPRSFAQVTDSNSNSNIQALGWNHDLVISVSSFITLGIGQGNNFKMETKKGRKMKITKSSQTKFQSLFPYALESGESGTHFWET